MNTPRPTSRQVFDEQARYVYRVLRYFGVRPADLPDVCQDVFITVHRKLDTFEGRSSIRTWLYKICQRAASDYRRRASFRQEIVTDAASPDLDRDEAGIAGRMEARSTLAFALDQLDEDKRHVFVLYEIEGMTMREVCDIVGCPLQTAYSRLHAARDIVIAALEPERKDAVG
jgi:RNA polymerase sigma-70 factor (ECF subfamily)